MRGSRLGAVKNTAVIRSIEQAPGFPETTVSQWDTHSGGGLLSGGEDLAALCAATVEDLAAALGGHAGAETVGALALQYAGLECSFHDFNPNKVCRVA